MSEHKDYGGECYRCGGDWPCDYDRGYRDALRQAADDLSGAATVGDELRIAGWLRARAEAVSGNGDTAGVSRKRDIDDSDDSAIGSAEGADDD